MITSKSKLEKNLEKIQKLRIDFEDFAKNFYTAEDASRNYTILKDRFGTQRQMPLLSVSASVLSIPKHVVIEDPHLFSDTLSLIKEDAKNSTNKIAVLSIIR